MSIERSTSSIQLLVIPIKTCSNGAMAHPATKQKSSNILELLQDGTHFAERVGKNTHIVNSLTGSRIVLSSLPPAGTPLALEARIDPITGVKHFYEVGVGDVQVPQYLAYTPAIIDEMCAKIAEGERLTHLCRKPEYPSYATLSRWRAAHADIDAKLERARRDRAEHYADSVQTLASEAEEDTINVTKVQIDAAKWAAAVDAPERYSPRAKVEASIQMPTQIIISTGIDRGAGATEVQLPPSTPGVQEGEGG